MQNFQNLKPKNNPNCPPPEIIAQIFEEIDGLVYYKYRPLSHFTDAGKWVFWNARFSGKLAGHECPQKTWNLKYVQIKTAYQGKSFRILAHTVVWVLHNKSFPLNQIDHINRNGLDNRIENLRDVTARENNQNRVNTKLKQQLEFDF